MSRSFPLPPHHTRVPWPRRTAVTALVSARGAASLPSRVAGVLRAPRATFSALAQSPRWAAVLVLTFAVTFSAAPRSSKPKSAGSPSWISGNVAAIAFGQPVDDARYAAFARASGNGVALRRASSRSPADRCSSSAYPCCCSPYSRGSVAAPRIARCSPSSPTPASSWRCVRSLPRRSTNPRDAREPDDTGRLFLDARRSLAAGAVLRHHRSVRHLVGRGAGDRHGRALSSPGRTWRSVHRCVLALAAVLALVMALTRG